MYNDVRVYRVKTTVDIEPRTKLSSQHFWSFKNSWWKIKSFINRSNQRLIKKYFICICKRRQGNILIKTLFSNFSLWKMWSREYAAIILRSCEKKHLFSKGGKKETAFSMGIGVSNSIFFLLLRGWQNIFTWCMNKTTSNMRCVNFTERPAWLVNSWTRKRCNLLPEVYTTPFFFPLILWNLKIFQKTNTRREMKIYMTRKIFLS